MASQPVEVKQTAPAPAASPDAWQSLRSEMDRLFDRFSAGFGLPSFRRALDLPRTLGADFTLPSPAVDISEDDAAYHLTAELPGMNEQEVEVSLSGDTLTIKGEKKQETERKDKNTFLSERSYGMFQRSFSIPEGVDHDKIEAKFAKGVLTLTLPKTPTAAAQPRKIDIQSA
jgi:HSP20 family protein